MNKELSQLVPAIIGCIALASGLYLTGFANSAAISFILPALMFGGLLCLIATALSFKKYKQKMNADLNEIGSELKNIVNDGTITKACLDIHSIEMRSIIDQFPALLGKLNRLDDETAMLRRKLNQNNSAKDAFIGKIGHELRTPIHSIMGILRILFRDESTPAKQQYLTLASQAASGLLDSINELLDLSKIEAGKLVLESVPFDIRAMIKNSLSSVATKAYEKNGLELIGAIDPEVADKYIGDANRLQQLITNLLRNSIQFSDGGSIGLSLRPNQQPGMLCIEVSNTRSERWARNMYSIITSSEQEMPVPTQANSVADIGLTIVKQMVLLMKGQVTVEAIEGEGGKLIIALPLSASQKRAIIRQEYRNENILLLDSHPGRLSYNATYLKQWGMSVTEVLISKNRSTKLPESIYQSYSAVIIDGSIIELDPIWDYIESNQKEVNPNRIVALLSPLQNPIKDKLSHLRVSVGMVKPVLAEDLITLIVDPLATDSHARMGREMLQSESPLGCAKDLKVLVVDDSSANRLVLKDILEEIGYTVVEAENGEEMLAEIEKAHSQVDSTNSEPFDLILADVEMPVMDGLTATKKLRGWENHKHIAPKDQIPVVIVTAHAFPEERAGIISSGANDVVTKPIRPGALAKVLDKIFSERFGVKTPKAQDKPAAHPGKFIEAVTQAATQSLQLTNQEWTRISDLRELVKESFDFQDLYERAGESDKRAFMILEACTQDLSILVGQLRQAIKQSDGDDIKKQLHALRGVLLQAGCVKAVNIVTKLEAGNIDLGDSLDKYVATVEQEVKFLDQTVKSLNSEH